jgi:anti-anti-sigma factor
VKLADVTFESSDRLVVASVRGELDMSNSDEVGAALADRVPNEALGLVVDLSNVDYMDSTGIHVVYELRERLLNRGQQIRLVVPPGSPVAETLRLAGVPSTVGVADTAEAARLSIGG